MAKTTDTAATASIGAATRELHLPTVRNESSRLAEMAQRDRQEPPAHGARDGGLVSSVVQCATSPVPDKSTNWPKRPTSDGSPG